MVERWGPVDATKFAKTKKETAKETKTTAALADLCAKFSELQPVGWAHNLRRGHRRQEVQRGTVFTSERKAPSDTSPKGASTPGRRQSLLSETTTTSTGNTGRAGRSSEPRTNDDKGEGRKAHSRGQQAGNQNLFRGQSLVQMNLASQEYQ